MKIAISTVFVLVVNLLFGQDSKLAENYFIDGNYSAALNEYEILINEDPENIDYNYNLAVCYINTNDDKSRAIPYLEFLVKDPKIIPDTWYLLGRAYHFGYQFNKAIQAYQKFLETGKGNLMNRDNAPLQIEYCENAKEIMKFPLSVSFENLGKNINTKFADYFPFIPVNESFILFNSNRNTEAIELPDGSYASNVYISEVKEGKYQKARPVSKINTPEGSEEIVGLKSNGEKAIIYVNDFSDYGDLYDCKINNLEFGSLVKLDKNVNTKNSEIAACITNDESKLFFASDKPDGYGGIDIYLCQKLPNGKWSMPQNLGPTINTKYDEDFPNISPDGKTLYFSSKGHTSMGGYDIFSATWDDSKKKFLGIQNLGYPINTPEDNMNFRISESGKYGYISAIRNDSYGNLDIYRVQFKSVEPRYTVIKGIISTTSSITELEDVYIQITDQETDEIYGDYAPNDISMRYVIILPPGKYNMYISAMDHEDIFEEIEIYDKASYKHEVDKNILLTPTTDN